MTLQRVLLAVFFLVIAASLPARADFLPVYRVTMPHSIPGGEGSDWLEVEVKSTQQAFDLGLHFIEFDYVHRVIRRRNLPAVAIREKCEFRRAGAPIGDYMPKAPALAINLGSGASGRLLWGEGDNRDYNVNPVVKNYEFSRTNFTSEAIPEYLAIICGLPREQHFVVLVWGARGMCHFRPEFWNKPGNFAWEYYISPVAESAPQRVRVNCVDH